MKAAEAACEAARIMSERGHCKGTLEDGEGRVCYAGALLFALNGDISSLGKDPAVDAVFATVMVQSGAILSERGYGIEIPLPPLVSLSYGSRVIRRDAVAFNNDPSVTGEDVVLLLKETAERLEENDSPPVAWKII